ncbi:orofacial cleft 1 candidate 1, partial [Mus musculus]
RRSVLLDIDSDGTRFKSVYRQGQRADNMDKEKFQQKAVKQTKQKKSTSAEFLMVKEYTEATEGAGNPGFNMSSPELPAHQTPQEKVVRHDMLDHTLATHQQKSRLPASAGPKGVTSVLIVLTLAALLIRPGCPEREPGIPLKRACTASVEDLFGARVGGDAAEDLCTHWVQVTHSFVGEGYERMNSLFFGRLR